MKRLIAITGGIGAGKSVVCRIVKALGYPVYDCDSRAREIIDNNPDIQKEIKDKIHAQAFLSSGSLDRALVGSLVFADPKKLAQLNAITHRAVREDLAAWVSNQESPTAFVETAILYQSGLDQMADEVWEVIAPEPLRLARVMDRNGLSAEQVKQRIAAQQFTPEHPHPRVSKLQNDGKHSLLWQIHCLL